MSHNAYDGVESSVILKRYFDKHPAIIPLLNLIRKMLKDVHQADPHHGGLSSFSVGIMLISYVEVLLLLAIY